MAKIFVKESEITVLSMNENDYISLTDIAKHKSDEPLFGYQSLAPKPKYN